MPCVRGTDGAGGGQGGIIEGGTITKMGGRVRKKKKKPRNGRNKVSTYSSLIKLPTDIPPQLMPPIRLPPIKLPARDSRLGRLP